MRVSSTDVQNNFGKYLKFASVGEEVIITRNRKDVAQLVPCSTDSIVAEGSAIYGGKESNRVSYEEFLNLTENSELRYELIDGEVYNLASPNYDHQDIVTELILVFGLWFKGKKCRPLTAPFDITLIKSEENINVVQPDIVIICDSENLDEKRRYKGVPSLVVEVLSKSTRSKDMVKKLDLYMQTGVNEYWVIDPKNKIVQVYNFKESNIDEFSSYKCGDIISSVVFSGLEVQVEELFSRLGN